MINPRGVFIAVVLAIVVFSLKNVDGTAVCRKKNYYCPNTTLSYNTDNLVVARDLQRRFVIDVLNSRFFSPLSRTARNFLDQILRRINTDSPWEVSVYFSFALWTLPFMAQSLTYPSLCLPAANVNSSVNWATVRDGLVSAGSARQTGNSVVSICNMLETIALTELDCPNVPEPPNLPSSCYKRGLVYAVEENLEINGKRLPCVLYQAILDLYSSRNYVDNMFAAMFSQSLTPEGAFMTAAIDLNPVLETNYLLLNNNVSVCCCAKRRQRFDILCRLNNRTINQDIEIIINERFLFDECATEPIIHP